MTHENKKYTLVVATHIHKIDSIVMTNGNENKCIAAQSPFVKGLFGVFFRDVSRLEFI